MFRKQDFKKVDLLGSGKKNTKIYKAEHIPTGKYYAIKEVEAKTLDKLNEYKVRKIDPSTNPMFIPDRKRPCNCSRSKAIQTCSSSTDITSMRRCTTRSASQWSASIWMLARISSSCSANASQQRPTGHRKS